MGQSRLLPLGVIALLLAGCGGPAANLLGTGNPDRYYGGDGGGGFFASSAAEADRGVIRGTVTYTGRKRAGKLNISRDYCINANPNGLMSEDFLVGDNGALGGVVVYVKRGLNRIEFPVPSEQILLDQKACRYVPHLAVARIGQPVVIRNSDQHEHNVHGMPGANPEFNVPMNTPGTLDPMTFSKVEIKSIKCDIHGWMQSYLAVLPNPCWAITKADGTFEITGVPPGHLQLAAWHERLGELTFDIDLKKNEEKTHDIVYEAK